MISLALASPAAAQGSDVYDRFAEGMQRLLDQLVIELGPGLEAIEGWIEDLNAYHAPEILPNGDIIIRRKEPLVPEDESAEEGVDI